MAYQWDAGHHYHFVMLTRGGTGIGPFAQMVDSLRRITRPKPRDPPANHPCGDRGPSDTVQSLAAGWLTGITRSSDSCVERACRQQPAGPRPEGQAGRLRHTPKLKPRCLVNACLDSVGACVHMPPAPPPRIESPPSSPRRSARQSAHIRLRSHRAGRRAAYARFVRIATTPPSSGPRPHWMV